MNKFLDIVCITGISIIIFGFLFSSITFSQIIAFLIPTILAWLYNKGKTDLYHWALVTSILMLLANISEYSSVDIIYFIALIGGILKVKK